MTERFENYGRKPESRRLRPISFSGTAPSGAAEKTVSYRLSPSGRGGFWQQGAMRKSGP